MHESTRVTKREATGGTGSGSWPVAGRVGYGRRMVVPVPTYARSQLVVDAPGAGAGWWAGGPSAVLDGSTWWLAYRLRRPVNEGRGYANVVARSRDGVKFDTVCTLERDAFEADSLERPALVRRPDGGWRIYVSCATPGSKHWRVDAIDAD